MAANACTPSTFDPSLFGAKILNIEANLVTNFSMSVPETARIVDPAIEIKDTSFCNVTVEFVHPGQGDNTFLEAWLPSGNPDWNGRFQAVGGGGWQFGRMDSAFAMMAGALADGFATVTSDGGLGSATTPTAWALNSPGNVNLYKLQDFGSVALSDQAILGKSLTKSYYGKSPEYSYFNGCSMGGRQGMMLAQRYPDLYDGISAGAPAMYLTEVGGFLYWPQQVMNELNDYPYGCELDAIRNATIAACDEYDGVKDGVISRPQECLDKFDPFSVVGKKVKCAQLNGTEIEVGKTAAIVANVSSHGLRFKGTKETYQGVYPGVDLAGIYSGGFAIGMTECTAAGDCTGNPVFLGKDYFPSLLFKDLDADISKMSREEFDDLAYSGIQQYSSLLETTDVDLTSFRDKGGKIISYHGLSDQLLPTKSSEKYFSAVNNFVDGKANDFYRLFEIPGLGHCSGGSSGQPTHLMRQLQAWVEKGVAPETSPIKLNSTDGTTHDRILCLFPKEAKFHKACGDASKEKCWSCQ